MRKTLNFTNSRDAVALLNNDEKNTVVLIDGIRGALDSSILKDERLAIRNVLRRNKETMHENYLMFERERW